ncbi:hypothetical protein EDD90_4758 [Streptomyces sp. Ag109_O5-1]|uniref:hypothetical protein n=1 Tax=Streptomyces sp. Ag109_O5-1 TaxID=1938851 RepID=UPI000F4D9EC4|nr:hypothetical protein [Streptomyces sp. Ag109_O5-1]RPE41667.1 hypothetical protein EDD90_4758 [Streptomyces sp. Ag109_O5-1]
MAERVKRHFGVPADAAAWCRIGKIPTPPKEIHQAAGDGPLRPALIRPLGALGMLLGGLFYPLLMLLIYLSVLEEKMDRLLGPDSERVRERAKDRATKEGRAALRAHGLDQVFDGNWSGSAGQFLLRWYSRSSHHNRLLVLTQDRIILAAPPKRVSIRQEAQTQVVAEIPFTEAAVEDPLVGQYASDRLRIRFSDDSWLTVITEETPSEVHTYVMRHSRLGSRPHTGH